MSPADDGGRQGRRGERDYDWLHDPLVVNNARILDPTRAVHRTGDDFDTTIYIADTLLFRDVDGSLIQAFNTFLSDEKIPITAVIETVDDAQLRQLRQLEGDAAEVLRDSWVTPVRLVVSDRAATSVDAWTLLQRFRATLPDNDVYRVGLSHLLSADISGTTMTAGWSVTAGTTMTAGWTMTAGAGVRHQYAIAGLGGRTPVAYLGPSPAPRKLAHGKPVIAVLDTGIGEHDWLKHDTTVEAAPGETYASDEPEDTGRTVAPLEGLLDDFAGHGTFIAGIIRQICPEAEIVMIKVMRADGFVPEETMIRSIGKLALDHIGGTRKIDALSMSFGYYHEEPDDLKTDASLIGPLTGLAAAGVTLFAAAGNDATTRRMYPAAFSTKIKLVSVGALNPNGTVALFSNSGDWVRTWERGAQVFSTQPTTFNGSLEPTARTNADGEGTRRESLDPDDFSHGFATWSGTSFATPAAAARYLRRLIARREAQASSDNARSLEEGPNAVPEGTDDDD